MQRDFSTARLCMRVLDDRDEALFCRIYTDAALMRHVAAPLSEAAARRGFRKARAGAAAGTSPWWLWVMRVDASGREIGLLGLQPGEDAEIGAMLLAEAHGSGYATEAIAMLVDLAFAVPGIACVRTRHARANGAAGGLMRKLGFAQQAGAEASRWQLTRTAWHDRGHRLPMAADRACP